MQEIPVNECQTQITEQLMSMYPQEVQDMFFDFVNNVEYIKNLISPSRRRAKDMPHDGKGRVIVDFENPHIIEDADYFRQPALHYMKYGCYTRLRPNKNPKSPYMQFWNEELKRCWNGYVRESDGEWVTGMLYWFLNYNPMVVRKIRKGSKKAESVESMPYFFEGIYLRFHYLNRARENGHHAIELAKRGAHPYFQRVITPDGIKKWGSIKVGDRLYGTYGNITKVTSIPVDKEYNGYYIIHLEDGRTVCGTYDHLWNVIIFDSHEDSPDESMCRGRACTVPTEQVRHLVHKRLHVYIPSVTVSMYGREQVFKGSYVIGVGYRKQKTMCKCVTVDARNSSYLIGNFVQTHNCGKSYTLSSIMTHNLEIGESEASKTRVTTVLTAYQKEYLRGDKDGTLSKFEPSLSFIQSNTAFPRMMLKRSPNEMSWQMGYRDMFDITHGSFNLVMGVSSKDDPGKLRGKRGWILFEEMGQHKNLLSLYDTTRKSTEDGDYTFGLMYLVGTSSDSESDFSSAKTLLQSPEAYNIQPIRNVYDKPKSGSVNFGYFFPAYMNRTGCYNEDGVSDVVAALLQVLMARHKAKYNSADPKSVLKVISEDPITPSEAITKVKAAYFPVNVLNERLYDIDNNPAFFSDVMVGALVMRDGNVEFKLTADEPIRQFGVSNDTQGAVEIFTMPQSSKDGKIPDGRYIAGFDPVDQDAGDSHSLASIFVFDLFTDSIVAEFTGRKPFAEDNYEIARLLCIFYNAKCLYESNIKGFYAYMKYMRSTHLLAVTPKYLRDMDMLKYNNVGSNAYGVRAIATINNYANSLIRDWLLETVEMQDKDNSDEYVKVPRAMTLRNRALIEELVQFRPELNVDRIRALGMVMLYREEKVILYGKDMGKVNEPTGSAALAHDDFFERNLRRYRNASGLYKGNVLNTDKLS